MTSDARKLSQDAQEALRERAIEAVENGHTHAQVAQLFGVHRGTVTRWWAKYQEGGAVALKKGKRGRKPGSSGRLAGHQAATIVNLITDRCPEQLKLAFFLWTREAVQELVWSRFGIRLSVQTVGKYLRRWGFTPQKPVRRAFERSDAKVKRWLEEEYPAIKREAKREGAEIHWGDEMGLRSDHQTGTTWSPRGKTPVVAGTGKRFRCNTISAISNRGTLRFRVFEGTCTASVFLDFLKRLVKSAGRLIYLVVDNHSVHRARVVRRWVDANPDKIKLYFLPPYSPDLNPDEFLNHDVKSNALGRRRPRDIHELKTDVRAYLRSTQRRPDVVRRYFNAKSIHYAA